MLRILDVAIEMVRDVDVYVARIGERNRDLARQLGRCSSSVPMNISEGGGLRGGNRRLRYLTALGSAEETRTGLRVAEALGYVEVEPALSQSASPQHLRHGGVVA